MIRNFLLCAFFALLFFYFISWFYRGLLLLIVTLVWRNEINEFVSMWPMGKFLFPTLICIATIMMLIPAISLNTGRTHLYYFEEKKDGRLEKSRMPIHHYIANLLVPECEIMNIATLGCSALLRFIPDKYLHSLMKQYKKDKGLRRAMIEPYKNRVPSGIYPQVEQDLGIGHQRAVYVTKPESFKKGETYPLLVFCHGYLGNWALYQSVMQEIEGYVVLSISTPDYTGIFVKDEINEIFSTYISFIEEELGCNIDRRRICLAGLSNGVSAARIAYYDSRFSDVAFISAGRGLPTEKTAKRVFYIGGFDTESDVVASSRANGNRADGLYNPEWNHYMIIRNKQEFVAFMNNALKQ